LTAKLQHRTESSGKECAMTRALTILSEEELLFKQEITKFADSAIKPLVMKMDESEQLSPELLRQLFEMGFMGIEIPSEFGGSGSSFFMACLAVEAISTIDPAISVIVDVQNTLINNVFKKWATKEQRAKFFPQLATSKLGAYCLTEANSGSDAFALKTRATDQGDHFLLDGKKIFITNAKEAEMPI
jgi:alkylation response protein AidB-like acyl-CoA dehydrogenase